MFGTPPLKYPYDPRTQLHTTVWHNDAKLVEFVRHLIETLRPARWVETGTHMGWTSAWIAAHYPWLPIYTVEVDPEFFRMASANLEEYPQVSIRHGDSVDVLAKLLPLLRDGLSVFWLDAHWWPPVPLRDECHLVSKLDRYVCLLDDFSCWGPDFSGDTFYTIAPNSGDAYLNDVTYVADFLGKRYWRPKWTPLPSSKGVGLFTKGVSYVPPYDLMELETLDVHLSKRPVGRADSYPPYPWKRDEE